MMKHFARAITLACVTACFGTIQADNTNLPLEEPNRGAHNDEARDWSQTHLFPTPALREQIERTNGFLQESAPGMIGDVSVLKGEGLLDRRNASKLRNALSHARRSMTGLAESIAAEEQMDGWSARMIAYELGMAADTFAKQAVLIEPIPRTGPKGSDGAPDDLSLEEKPKRHLAGTLREGSDLLKETARTIVRHLK